MNQQYAEIAEIPHWAKTFWHESPAYSLPLAVPYLGMGSSYFAALAFKYMGLNIQPEMAAEFYHYAGLKSKIPHGVILSQSGRSTEALWCTALFEEFTAITNFPESALATASNAKQVIRLLAGNEQYSSSNTYINTLLALFKGFGYQAEGAIQLLVGQLTAYENKGKELARQVYDLLSNQHIQGIYITGNGPNIATAYQAALILSESTKRTFTGLPMAQYDHGPKETAQNSILIQVIAPGKTYERSQKLARKIAAAGGHVFAVEEIAAEEHFSVLHNIIPFNFMAYYLAQHLNITETFTVGGKVTEVI